MKVTKAVNLRTSFGPEVRFEVRPSPAGLARREQERKLDMLKSQLLEESLTEAEGQVRTLVAQSANEAAALAWLSGYPLLVFPSLFEEKVDAALQVTERQVEIRERSRELLAA